MKKSFLAVTLSILLVLSSCVGLFGCQQDDYFVVTFSPGEYQEATLASGFTEEHLVQRVKDASELVLPVFICDKAYHVGWNDIPANITKDTTLTAVWYKKNFVVNFEPGARDAVLVSGSERIETNSTVNIIPPVYERPGYVMDPAWGGFNFQTINSNTTITAKWLPNEYKIYLKDSDSEELIFDENSNVKVDENGRYYVSALYEQQIGQLPTPKKDGKTFGAWKLSDVSTKIFSESAYKYLTDIELETVWLQEGEFLIFYNGLDTTDNPVSYTLGDEFTLNNPTKEGYEFLGWTFDGQTTPTFNARITAQDIGNREFTANWRAKTYTIELDAVGGSISNRFLQVTYGGQIENLPIPQKEGFEFESWSTKNGTVIEDNSVWEIDDTSVVLTAKYKRIYTIKFVLKCMVDNTEVYCNFENGTYESLGLVKSETDEHVYYLYNVKEDTNLPMLPKAKPYTKRNGDSFYFDGWRHKRPAGKEVTVTDGMIVNESKFPGTYDLGEIEFVVYCYSDWISGWY